MGTQRNLDLWYQNIGRNGVMDLLVARTKNLMGTMKVWDRAMVEAYVTDVYMNWHLDLKHGYLRGDVSYILHPDAGEEEYELRTPTRIPDTEEEYVELVAKIFNNSQIWRKISTVIKPKKSDFITLSQKPMVDPDYQNWGDKTNLEYDVEWSSNGITPENLLSNWEDGDPSRKFEEMLDKVEMKFGGVNQLFKEFAMKSSDNYDWVQMARFQLIYLDLGIGRFDIKALCKHFGKPRKYWYNGLDRMHTFLNNIEWDH